MLYLDRVEGRLGRMTRWEMYTYVSFQELFLTRWCTASGRYAECIWVVPILLPFKNVVYCWNGKVGTSLLFPRTTIPQRILLDLSGLAQPESRNGSRPCLQWDVCSQDSMYSGLAPGARPDDGPPRVFVYTIVRLLHASYV